VWDIKGFYTRILRREKIEKMFVVSGVFSGVFFRLFSWQDLGILCQVLDGLCQFLWSFIGELYRLLWNVTTTAHLDTHLT
jgi:hypothetical protein